MSVRRLSQLLLQCFFGITPYSPEEECVEPPAESTLYVVLPYFNFCHSERRKNLFIEFVDRYHAIPGIKLVIVEGALKDTEYDLPTSFEGVDYHYGFVLANQLWIKENLINLAIKQLPASWKYVAWIDADLIFLNENWVQDTIKALQSDFDVLQPFHTALHMGPSNEALKIERSFGYMHLKSDKAWLKSYKYGFWHPGFAWAITKEFYNRIEGLIDFAILGSGDHHMSLAFIKKVDCSHPGGVQDSYKKKLQEFQERCGDVRLGYIPGTILHQWHGRLEDRKYIERWDILVKGKYNPSTYIRYNQLGVIQFTELAQDIIPQICSYFSGRKEDNKEV